MLLDTVLWAASIWLAQEWLEAGTESTSMLFSFAILLQYSMVDVVMLELHELEDSLRGCPALVQEAGQPLVYMLWWL